MAVGANVSNWGTPSLSKNGNTYQIKINITCTNNNDSHGVGADYRYDICSPAKYGGGYSFKYGTGAYTQTNPPGKTITWTETVNPNTTSTWSKTLYLLYQHEFSGANGGIGPITLRSSHTYNQPLSFPITYKVNLDDSNGITMPQNAIKILDTPLTLGTPECNIGKYTITFDPNGGIVDETQKTLNGKLQFKNWNTASNGSGTSYSVGAKYTGNSALTLYAQWEEANNNIKTPKATKQNTPAICNVTFMPQGGSLSGATTISCQGVNSYTGLGWFTSNGEQRAENDGEYGPTQDETLYQYWQVNPAFNTITLPICQRTNYAFKGWAESPTASSGLASGTLWAPSGDTVLYAIWEKITYTINYDYPGIESQEVEPNADFIVSSASLIRQSDGKDIYTINFKDGNTTIQSISTPTYKQYTFKNYYLIENSETEFKSGETYRYNWSNDITLIPQWSSRRRIDPIILPEYSKPDQIFLGWNTDDEATVGIKGSFTPPGDLVLHAIFGPPTAITCTKQLNYLGKVEKQQFSSQGQDALISWLALSENRPGYTFLGWYDQPEGGNLITDFTPTEITYWAHWQPNIKYLKNNEWRNVKRIWFLQKGTKSKWVEIKSLKMADIQETQD